MDKTFDITEGEYANNFKADDLSDVISSEGHSDEIITATPDGKEEDALAEAEGKSLLISDDFMIEEEKTGGGTVIMRLTGALLCFLFCIVSLAFYSVKAAGVAQTLLSNGLAHIINTEVFDKNAVFEEEKAPEDTNEIIENNDIPQTDASTEDSKGEAETEVKGETNDAPPDIYNVVETDLSAKSPYLLKNETSFKPDVSALAATSPDQLSVSQIYEKYGSDAPCILIVHTHGTESYSDGKDTYSTTDEFRTQDTAKNVVAVGDVMEAAFRCAGVNVLHDRNMYDKESYKDSYSRCYASVKTTLENNPSICYVLDVHRDSIIDDNKTKYSPVFEFDGQKAAQMMIVVGTDEGGADHPTWSKNLTLALGIQKSAFSSISPSLSRSINLRSAAFNQGLSSGSLLLEVGSCGNTLEEAKRCAVLSALAIAKVIGGKDMDAEPLMDTLVPSEQ